MRNRNRAVLVGLITLMLSQGLFAGAGMPPMSACEGGWANIACIKARTCQFFGLNCE